MINKLDHPAIEELFSLPLDILISQAAAVRKKYYGRSVFIRGLLEFTNYCSCNCKYCGLRKNNDKAVRYSMSEKEIISSVLYGLELGLRTFVLQGGEDPLWPVKRLVSLVRSMRRLGDNYAITLSCGIKSYEDYRSLVDAGANRYLLRFETSDPSTHSFLRDGISLQSRMRALDNLRRAGFEVGSGFMVGLPGESDSIRLENLRLCLDKKFDMIGIGPFIANKDTPLASCRNGSMEDVVRMTAILRIILPFSNIPATTAAGSLVEGGRRQMLKAGANVLMPNITPLKYRSNYLLYPGKDTIKNDGVEELAKIEKLLKELDLEISNDRGDSLSFKRHC